MGISSFPVGSFVNVSTPVERIKKLSDAIKKVTEDTQFKSMMEKTDMPVLYDDSEEFKKKLEKKRASTSKAYRALGFSTEVDN